MERTALTYTLVPILAVALIAGLVSLTPLTSRATGGDYRVTITNISNTILTPPVAALTRRDTASFYTLGESASEALEMLAEGGDTAALAEFFEDHRGASVATHDAPIMPGESIELELNGRGHLYLASMLLPTNDAFIALNGLEVRGSRTITAYANAYDAGTEENTEDTDDIPGPFGGEGFNEERDDVDFVHPHPGIHGEDDISVKEYNWSDPVAKIVIEKI